MTSNLHVLCDREERPVGFYLSEGPKGRPGQAGGPAGNHEGRAAGRERHPGSGCTGADVLLRDLPPATILLKDKELRPLCPWLSLPSSWSHHHGLWYSGQPDNRKHGERRDEMDQGAKLDINHITLCNRTLPVWGVLQAI